MPSEGRPTNPKMPAAARSEWGRHKHRNGKECWRPKPITGALGIYSEQTVDKINESIRSPDAPKPRRRRRGKKE